VKDLTAQLKAMTSARTVEELWEMHTEKMATYGFDRLIYGFTRYITSSSLGNPQDWLVFTNMPASYMQVAIEEEHFQNGPMIRWALEMTVLVVGLGSLSRLAWARYLLLK
jgi:LuxR family transcriptional regulator